MYRSRPRDPRPRTGAYIAPGDTDARNLPPFDLLIRGGTVIDGTRAPRFDADVGISTAASPRSATLADRPAKRTLDAAGRIVAPGFIDAHTHDDQALLSQPDMSFKVSQGVTTVVAGNCGISIAPLAADTPLPSPLDLLDASERGRYADFAAYFEQLERTPAAVNVASLVGHTTLRVRTMSSIDRPAEADEIMAMQRLLDEALRGRRARPLDRHVLPARREGDDRGDHRGRARARPAAARST